MFGYFGIAVLYAYYVGRVFREYKVDRNVLDLLGKKDTSSGEGIILKL